MMKKTERSPLIMKVFMTIAILLLSCRSSLADTDKMIILLEGQTNKKTVGVDDSEQKNSVRVKLGTLLAAGLKKEPVFLKAPRKRNAMWLSEGRADIICMVSPIWFHGDFYWTEKVYTDRDLLLVSTKVPKIDNISAIKGQRIGTVLGYSYPTLQAIYGQDNSWREDAISSLKNLEKFKRERVSRIVISEQFLNYNLKDGFVLPPIHEPLPVAVNKLYCVISKKSKIDVNEINKVIRELEASHALD